MSKKSLNSEIMIDAPPDRVWELLTDFDRYPEWNPFVRKAQGDLREGGKLEVSLQPPGKKSMTFRPRLTRVDPHHEFRWLGRLGVPGLFDGEHIFTIEELPDGGVRFIQRENFGGVFSGLILRSIGANTLKGFNEMNRALKHRAEAAAS